VRQAGSRRSGEAMSHAGARALPSTATSNVAQAEHLTQHPSEKPAQRDGAPDQEPDGGVDPGQHRVWADGLAEADLGDVVDDPVVAEREQTDRVAPQQGARSGQRDKPGRGCGDQQRADEDAGLAAAPGPEGGGERAEDPSGSAGSEHEHSGDTASARRRPGGEVGLEARDGQDVEVGRGGLKTGRSPALRFSNWAADAVSGFAAGAELANANAHIIRRLGRPEEIASMVAYFLREGSFLTGLTYPVDGGWSVKGNY
jgi:hypothetical protein